MGMTYSMNLDDYAASGVRSGDIRRADAEITDECRRDGARWKSGTLDKMSETCLSVEGCP